MTATDWNPLLRGEFDEQYWRDLQHFVAEERSQATVFPPRDEVFAALHLTPYAATRVLILGQDPYHGPGQAHGLCFSVRRGVRRPPSLDNIFKELADDVGPDVWTDTSTLFARLLRGHNGWVDEGDISAEHSRGTLRLTMPMFARQLSTFRGTPSDIAGFGRFFAAQLWGIYRGPARSPLR